MVEKRTSSLVQSDISVLNICSFEVEQERRKKVSIFQYFASLFNYMAVASFS